MENARRCPNCRQSLTGALSVTAPREAAHLPAAAAIMGAADERILSNIRAREALRSASPTGDSVNVLPAQQVPWESSFGREPMRMVARPTQETIAIAERNARRQQASVQEAAARARQGAATDPAAHD